MAHGASTAHRWSRWMGIVAWSTGGFLVSAFLATACIIIGAMLAMALEFEASRTVGITINAAALVAMIALYAGSLWVLASTIRARRTIPVAAWYGVGFHPLLWMALMATAPSGVIAETPAVVSAAGALIAWFALRGVRGTNPAHSQDPARG